MAEVKKPVAVAPKAEEKKVEPVAAVKAEPAAEKKVAAVKKAAAKKPAVKKAAAAKKPAAKKSTVNLFVQYQGGNVSTDDIVKKALEVSGKKTVKELNVYYQPENNIVYFTADGENGSFNY